MLSFISFSGSTLKLFYRNIFILLCLFISPVYSQKIQNVMFSRPGILQTGSLVLTDSTILSLNAEKPLFSFLLNDKFFKSSDAACSWQKNEAVLLFAGDLKVTWSSGDPGSNNWTPGIVFENRGSDTLKISNVVPFGEDTASVYITGYGPPDLARARLFRPGCRPVRVILPDNAWEMGYASFSTGGDLSVCSIARRQICNGGEKKRYETILPPGAKVNYTIHSELFTGEWQQGLRLMFRDKLLFDLENFDNTLYERKDLAWIRESYLIVLQMAWDHEFYNRMTGKYTFPDVIREGRERFGRYDIYCLWPTWPRLGLDQRNQWDLYHDLPGGTGQLRNFANMSRLSGTRFFISYNPWDNSTRREDHLKGLAGIISETEADGVVLDTRGSSSYELQHAADSVRKGVIMYSEGMAIPRDMPGIIAGRVHDAIFMSPELNLNKLIKPDFAIFRVCDVGEDVIHREVAIAFFNGYGTELLMSRPGGRDDNFENDLDFLAKTTFILRQNNDAFLDNKWTPLVTSAPDGVYVNEWKSGEKKVYTVLNMNPEGFHGRLFEVRNGDSTHFVSLWNHENLTPESGNGITTIKVNADGWQGEWSGTRREGSVDCIAELPELLRSELNGDSVKISYPGKGRVVIWKGNPSYETDFRELVLSRDTVVSISELFGYYEGKIVIQLLEDNLLLDENVLRLKGGKPWLVNRITLTRPATGVPSDMVLIPGTSFSFDLETREDFIPYPDINGKMITVDSFLIDKFPVTNAQYYEFILSTGYYPRDTVNYLRHWEGAIYRQGQDNYPVVYVSYEDVMAYTKWADKRLPTEAEWQLAARGTDNRLWPWGNEFHGTYCNNAFERPTPVDAFSKGKSPYGVMDLVGNVWQMTNDIYFNGSYYFMVIRGGSYYRPDSSWWYIEGGPQPLNKTQILLMVSPGFDRSATVGFRCVKDIDKRAFKSRR